MAFQPVDEYQPVQNPSSQSENTESSQRGLFSDFGKLVGQFSPELGKIAEDFTSGSGSKSGGSAGGSGGGHFDIAQGLKEALHHAINATLELIGKEGGFFNNRSIKIPVPEKLHKITDVMRSLGLNKVLDEFEHSLNRAAEQSAPAARDVLGDTVKSLHFEDVEKIWKGGNTAITSFFHERMSGHLLEKFTPIVKRTLEENNATKHFEHLHEKTRSVPFISHHFDINLNEYTCKKAVDGLFHVLAEEETKIRNDPQKQCTALLQHLFGGHQ